MKSFDFYDTLVTRLVAKPADIFRLVEESIDMKGFTRMRSEAELVARRATPEREVTLKEIYSAMDLPLEIRDEAMDAEIRLEGELVAPVRQNIERLAKDDVVISDMYLPSVILTGILSRCAPAAEIPRVLVSSEVGKRKSDGCLWDHVKAQLPHLQLHIGDNHVSDIRQANRRGIQTIHFQDAGLTGYEHRYADRSLDGSLIAGIARATRLSTISELSTPIERASVNAFSSVFAPLLVAFVEWVLDDCVAQGIRSVFFLARDGQLPYLIACHLIEARTLPIEPHYIYGSRQALHVPGFTDIDSAESWLLEDTPVLTLRDIAERGGLPPEIIVDLATDYSFAGVDENIPRSRRRNLRELIRDRRFLDAITTVSKERWGSAFTYYNLAGLFPGRKVALVDIGWNGRMQGSLRSLLLKSDASPVTMRGYYLCLSKKTRLSDFDRLYGFLHDPDQNRGRCFYDAYRGVLEAVLSADHASTVSFIAQSGKAKPVFGRQPSSIEIDSAHRQHKIVLTFVSLLLRVETALGRRIVIDHSVAAENLRKYLSAPRRTDAMAFDSRFQYEGQVEGRSQPLVTLVGLGRNLLRRRALGLWPEGSVAASGHERILPALRATRFIKNMLLRLYHFTTVH
jgi:FMN phosphatase YigB (HAD superfamily)